MRTTLWLMVLIATPALAGHRGALREVRDSLKEAVSAAEDSDSRCGRKLTERLERVLKDARDADEEDAGKLLRRAKEAREVLEESCPGRMQRRVGQPLDEAIDGLKSLADGDDDEREERHERRSEGSARSERRDERVRRDCGTGEDPGCSIPRGGQWAMDRTTFQGFMAALRSNQNEFTKLDVVKNTLSANQLTAVQLGQVLEQFKNEFTKLDAAKVAAPRLTDPSHALGHAAQFRNSFTASDYSAVIAAQK